MKAWTIWQELTLRCLQLRTWLKQLERLCKRGSHSSPNYDPDQLSFITDEINYIIFTLLHAYTIKYII